MSTTLPAFTPIEETLYLTLYGRPLDNHLPNPILADPMASSSSATSATTDAVGLDLGAGLDTRVFRLDPPAGVDWYDVDFPEVITARERLLPRAPTPTASGPT